MSAWLDYQIWKEKVPKSSKERWKSKKLIPYQEECWPGINKRINTRILAPRVIVSTNSENRCHAIYVMEQNILLFFSHTALILDISKVRRGTPNPPDCLSYLLALLIFWFWYSSMPKAKTRPKERYGKRARMPTSEHCSSNLVEHSFHSYATPFKNFRHNPKKKRGTLELFGH